MGIWNADKDADGEADEEHTLSKKSFYGHSLTFIFLKSKSQSQ